MMHKLTISVDDEVYKGLYAVIGRRKISRFLSDLARPVVAKKTLQQLEEGYKALAADEEQNREADEWEKMALSDMEFDD